MPSPSVHQPIPFPTPPASRPLTDAVSVGEMPSGRMLRAPNVAAAAPADVENAKWRGDLAVHAAGIDTLLAAAARWMGVSLNAEDREAIAWRALGQLDAAVREVAVHKGKRAFLATLGTSPRISKVDDAVRASIDAYEARLALGRIR